MSRPTLPGIRPRGRVRHAASRLLAALAVAAGFVAVDVTPSYAWYSHNQPCFHAPYSQCYDSQGQIYNPWVLVQTSMDDQVSVPGICAKAITAAGNVKTPTGGGNGCTGNTWLFAVNYYASPTSNAYGYWGDGGCHCWGARRFHVYARTA